MTEKHNQGYGRRQRPEDRVPEGEVGIKCYFGTEGERRLMDEIAAERAKDITPKE